MTDVAAAVGLHQLRRAVDLWARRSACAERYGRLLADLPLELPVARPDRRHSWHLYAVRLAPGRWRIDRNRVIELLTARGIGIAVQWMPLHLHPYYRETYGYQPGLFPVSEDVWPRIFSLPLYPDMTEAEQQEVAAALRDL